MTSSTNVKLRRVQMNDELEFGCSHHRQVGRLVVLVVVFAPSLSTYLIP
jgi:hypothetical protein